MGLLDAAKNIISGKSPNYEPIKAPDNRIDRVDQCKVIWYQWANELNSNIIDLTDTSPIGFALPDEILADSRSYDISNHIETFSFSKGMDAGAGAFQITLQNSFDWARYMRPGQWLCVFLTGKGDLPMPFERGITSTSGISSLDFLQAFNISQVPSSFFPTPELPLPEGPGTDQMSEFKPYMRCMGIIQRVCIRTITTADGVLETSYVITGKDFGTVYEETELWFNANNADGVTFDKAIHAIAQQSNRNLTELLSDWHDIFVQPSNELSKQITSVSSFFPVQWVLPNRLISDLDLDMNPDGQGTFGDIEGVKEFNATVFENPQPFPFAGIQGNCWEKLKSLSQPEFHELFTELSDAGNPKLIFRPIPWGINTEKYPIVSSVSLKYKDLTSLKDVFAPLPFNTNVGDFFDPTALNQAIYNSGATDDFPEDARTKHSVPISLSELETSDLGPDNHARHNFFIVDAASSAQDQINSYAILAQKPNQLFPLRDESDIKRHGFKPQFLNVNTFNISNGQLFGSPPDLSFMLELNYLIKDFWASAEDFYSGSMTLGAGRNDVKLGKVILTDNSFAGTGIDSMVFYIEQYTDNFAVNADGVGAWAQTINVTRGMQLSVLEGKNSKDQQSKKTSTFHIDQNGAGGDDSLLGKIKSTIKDPTSLF